MWGTVYNYIYPVKCSDDCVTSSTCATVCPHILETILPIDVLMNDRVPEWLSNFLLQYLQQERFIYNITALAT